MEVNYWTQSRRSLERAFIRTTGMDGNYWARPRHASPPRPSPAGSMRRAGGRGRIPVRI